MILRTHIDGLPPGPNQRSSHRMAAARVTKKWRRWAATAVLAEAHVDMLTYAGPVVLRLVRIYAHPAKRLESDNLQGALKPVRDGECGPHHDEDGARFRIEYGQRRGMSSRVVIEVEIREAFTAASAPMVA